MPENVFWFVVYMCVVCIIFASWFALKLMLVQRHNDELMESLNKQLFRGIEWSRALHKALNELEEARKTIEGMRLYVQGENAYQAYLKLKARGMQQPTKGAKIKALATVTQQAE